jgi:selenobiotic family peptide radical SAM maturase
MVLKRMCEDIPKNREFFRKVYPVLSGMVPDEFQEDFFRKLNRPEDIDTVLQECAPGIRLPPYALELARMERRVFEMAQNPNVPSSAERLTVNPSLELFKNSWKNLASLVDSFQDKRVPEAGDEFVMIWYQPLTDRVRVKTATSEDLLVLKMVLEELNAGDLAREGQLQEAAVHQAVVRALDSGMLIGPRSGIVREFDQKTCLCTDKNYDEARAFTLQWHITQACDLHCRHCYDRDSYASIPLDRGITVLDDMVRFCRANHVHGQVTFTGGNPLLYPHFDVLYRAAADRGLTTAILGNPASREDMERILDIQPPAFFQVSLEGLEEHNDYMRGKGHFNRIMSFLAILKDLGVYSMVMLTLTRENMDQVLPLAERLRNRADQFTFNRLSLMGEGANLVMADPRGYRDFLMEYLEAAETNPVLGLKDNLINILLDQKGLPLFGGCTGHGCGAAFNFLTLLANGDVHACRKFPSFLGNILDRSLDEIYFSEAARKYREGPEECRDCRLRSVCRGCLAVSHSLGLDIFFRKDPYCFLTVENLQERRITVGEMSIENPDSVSSGF